MRQSTNYKFNLPEGSDFYNVGDFTGNFEQIDLLLKALEAHASRHKKGGADALTPADIGASPAGYGVGEISTITISDVDKIDTLKTNGKFTLSNNTGAPLVLHGVSFNICALEVHMMDANHGSQVVAFIDGKGIKRMYVSGSWQDWVDLPTADMAPNAHTHTKSEITDFSHYQSASTITEGQFSGWVSASPSRQSYGSYLLRNTKLASAEETPTEDGAICWTYK